ICNRYSNYPGFIFLELLQPVFVQDNVIPHFTNLVSVVHNAIPGEIGSKGHKGNFARRVVFKMIIRRWQNWIVQHPLATHLGWVREVLLNRLFLFLFYRKTTLLPLSKAENICNAYFKAPGCCCNFYLK